MIEPEALLEKIPKRTPVWAVGVISIIVSLSVSFGAVYILSKGEFQQYLTSHFAATERIAVYEAKETERRALVEGKAFDTVLGLIQVNSTQITELTIANNRLAERVTTLERDLNKATTDLQRCEESLRHCKR